MRERDFWWEPGSFARRALGAHEDVWEALVENSARELLAALERRPVAPAVRSLGADLDAALAGDHAAVFVLGGDVFELVELLPGRDTRPSVFVNVDLTSGVSSDVGGIRYLSRHVEGVISTHRRTIELTKQTDLFTVQRLFAIDSGAVERGLKMITRAQPAFVEILPALAYSEIADYYRAVCGIPVLAGGLVTDSGGISSLLDAGASGVSTSDSGLWNHGHGGV